MILRVPSFWRKYLPGSRGTLESLLDLSGRERLLAVALGAVFFLFPISSGLRSGALLLAAAVWVGTGLVLRGFRQGVRQTWFLPLLYVVLLTFAGLLWSPDPAMGLDDARRNYHWLLALAVASIPVTLPLFRGWMSAFLCGTSLTALVALLQVAGSLPFWKKAPSAFQPKIAFSLLLAAAILLFLRRLAMPCGTASRILLSCGGLACWAALVYCRGRAGVLALAIGLPLAALLLFFPRKGLRGKAVLLALAIVAATMAMPVVQMRMSQGRRDLQIFMARGGVFSLGARLLYWKEGWQMFLEHPLAGVGSGGYRVTFQERYPKFPGRKPHAHSSYLTVASELGLAGLVGWGALGWVLFRAAWKRRRDEVGYTALAFGLVLLVGSLTDIEIQKGVMLCFLALVTGSLSASPAGDLPRGSETARRRA